MIERRAHELGAGDRTEADRPEREDNDRVADPDAARFGAAEAGRGDIGQEHDLLIADAIGDRREVGLGGRDEDVFGLATVDGVAEAPAAHGFVAAAVAALAEVAGQAGAALAARGDRRDEDALTDFVAGDARAELVDDADRLVADDQARADRILALEDVDVGAADRGRRDADDGLADPGSRTRHGLDADVAGAVEDGRAHRLGDSGLGRSGFGDDSHVVPPDVVV